MLFALLAHAAPLPVEWVPAPDFAYHTVSGVELAHQVVGDFDADGYDDLAWFAPGGAGEPTAGVALVFGGPGGLVGAPQPLLPGGEAYALAVSDLTGDGVDDLVVGVPGPSDILWPGEIRVFAGSTAGLPAEATFRVQGGPNIRNLGKELLPAGDLDGDGWQDLLVAHEFYAVWSWMRGDGTDLQMQTDWEVTGELLAADLDGDGYSDVAREDSGQDAVDVYLGGPDGLSTTPSWALELDSTIHTLADVTGDGLPEVGVAVSEPARMDWYSFAGGLPDAPALSTPAPLFGALFSLDDMDGDGLDDWFFWNIDFEINLILGASPEVVEQTWVLTSPWPTWSLQALPVTGDFDGDGCPDLSVQSEATWIFDLGTGLPGSGEGEDDYEIAMFLCPVGVPEQPPVETGETGETGDTGTTPEQSEQPEGIREEPAEERGCGCANTGAPSAWTLLLALGVSPLAASRRGRGPGSGVRATSR